MTKEEFIKELRSALSGEVHQDVLNENIRYYDQYLSQEQQKGRTIDEIVEEIGNPRLIARTIIDTSSNVSGTSSYYDQQTEQNDGINYSKTIRKAKIGIAAAIFIVFLIVIGVIAILGRVISIFAPILLPLLLISIAVRLITRQRN